MHRYEMLGAIGEGAYGVVHRCRNRQTKQIVAIKKFKESEEDEAVRKTTTREIHLLKLCSNSHIITLKEAYRQKKIVYLVFEYVQYNLLEVIEKHPLGLDPSRIASFIYQILKGIAYMHSLDVVHRDVKPENLLVSQKDHVKLCDFGFARELKSQNLQLTDYVSTRWYRPPELLVGARYDKSIDIWATGCIMGQLIDGNPMFPGDNQIDQLYKIQKCLGEMDVKHSQTFTKNKRFVGIKFPKMTHLESIESRYSGKTSAKGLSLLESLLKMTPGDRPTAVQAINHQYFDQLRQDDFLKRVTADRQTKVESRKTSASSVVNPARSFWKSGKQVQHGTPYVKDMKVFGTSRDFARQIKKLAPKEVRYTRQDWRSSQVRQAGQPQSKTLNKSIATSHVSKRQSLESHKSSSQFINTQAKFGLSYSKLSINRIYGSKQENNKFGFASKVIEEESQT